MLTRQNVFMCTCCIDARPLHYLGTENIISCLASGHVYERMGENYVDTGIDAGDYQGQQNYQNLEFPAAAMPDILPQERIDLSRYGYS